MATKRATYAWIAGSPERLTSHSDSAAALIVGLIWVAPRASSQLSARGTGGIVDLKVGAVRGPDQQIDLETAEIGVHSTPAVAGDVVIVGSSFREGGTVSTHDNTKGLVRAFDVRTGKKI